MARTIKDATLSDKDKRALKKLPGTAKPGPGAGGDKIFYHTITPGVLHLGYRRRKENTEGVWLARVYEKLEAGATGSPYKKYVLGRADDYRDADGKKVLSFNQARKAAEQKLEALEGEKEVATAPKPLTVREAMADYIAYLKAEKKTGDDAERRTNVHILPALGDKAIASLDKITLVKWRDSMAAAPARLRPKKSGEANYKPAPATPAEKRARRATVNRTMTILKAALNRAYDHDLVPSDKAWVKLKPFEAVEVARAGYLTVEQAKRFINAADAASGFRAIAHAALLTGCRYGELCRMRVRDFEYEQIAINESKSGKPRHVILDEEGIAFFNELTAGRPADQLMFLRAADDTASRRKEGMSDEEKQAWAASLQNRPMLAACKAAQITPAIGFHQLRHTYASLAIMNGTPLLVVATNLGHTDTRMVEKHYGHLTKSYMHEAIRAGAPKFGITSPGTVVPFKAQQPGKSDKSRFGVSKADILPLEADEMLVKKDRT
ncbi:MULTISPECIES: tyrosine-type recombinase/integrase [unclassified Phyllobacterium]|uniref:tyrosine-type recombinase/integrase n=1 Tax=unclassified Phyllobacterium TaxID=2638441 RepID=UPI003013011E